MWRRKWIPWLLLCLFGLSLGGYAQQGDWMSLQRRVVEIYEENKDALVRVKAVYESEDTTPQVIIGTGFFISNQGLVMANASVAHNPVRVWVEHRGVAYAAEVVGTDVSSNIALLRLTTLPREFGFIHLSDNADMPPIGRFVIRLSMPLDFDPTPDLGLIAGYESRFAGRFFPCKYIRTTIDASPGDGGAAFLDLSGRLIGIQVVSLPEVSSTYMLPTRAALRLRDDFLFYGKVTYGWIGFEVREETDVRRGKRLILEEVFSGAPAEEAGLMSEDVLLKIGDFPVRSVDDLRNAMFYSRVGQYVNVRVARGEDVLEFSVRLAERPQDEPMEVLRPIQPPDPLLSPMRTSDEEAEPLMHPRFPQASPTPDNGNARSNIPLQRNE